MSYQARVIEAVIFDRDGVLTDFDIGKAFRFFQPILPVPLDKLFHRFEEWGKLFGFPHTVTGEKKFWYWFWQLLGDELNLSDTVRTQLHTWRYTDAMFPYPEAAHALQSVRESGLKVGVLSNSSFTAIETSMKVFNFDPWINVAYCAADIGVAKPDSGAYQKIAHSLGVRPEACLFFDDEIGNVVGAQEVGMQAYLVDRRHEVNDLEARVVCDLGIVPEILAHYCLPLAPLALSRKKADEEPEKAKDWVKYYPEGGRQPTRRIKA